MKQKLLKLSLIMILIAAGILVFNYFFFHFVTDTGISFTWNPEPGKPFVSELIGDLAVLFIFGSAVSLLLAFFVFNDEDKKDE